MNKKNAKNTSVQFVITVQCIGIKTDLNKFPGNISLKTLLLIP